MQTFEKRAYKEELFIEKIPFGNKGITSRLRL